MVHLTRKPAKKSTLATKIGRRGKTTKARTVIDVIEITRTAIARIQLKKVHTSCSSKNGNMRPNEIKS